MEAIDNHCNQEFFAAGEAAMGSQKNRSVNSHEGRKSWGSVVLLLTAVLVPTGIRLRDRGESYPSIVYQLITTSVSSG